MKILKALIFLLLFVSCSDKERIAEFEEILGEENSETLTLLVSDFENKYLKTKYPHLTTPQAYEKLLTDIRDHKSQSSNQLLNFDKTRFQKSHLKHELYSYVDSVWVETHSEPKIVRQYKYWDVDTFRTKISWRSYRPQDKKNKDAIIQNSYMMTDLNYSGRFWVALKKTCGNDKFITDYLEMMNIAGPVQPEIMAYYMLSAGLDYSDYFIKRILITGLY